MNLRVWAAQQEAHRALAALAASPADAMDGLRGIAAEVRKAAGELSRARLAAWNTEAAVPDTEGAEVWCDYCGQSDRRRLVNDGLEDADPEYRCRSLSGCLSRRAERHPDRDTPEVKLARQRHDHWRSAALSGALALASFQAATDTTLALTAPRSAAQPRPRPRPGGDRSHLMSGDPANRAWTAGAASARRSRRRAN